MKKIISILLTTSMLAGSAAMPFTAIAAETVTTASRASEAAKTGTLTVNVYNEDEGGLYTDERTSFMITGSPDQTMSYGMGGSTFLCSVKPSESNPFVLNDIDIISNTNYTIIDSGSPDYDGFNYRIDYERSDRTFKFTENPNQDLSIYMKKNYFVVNSDKSVTVATHGQDIFDNMQAVMSQTLAHINSDDFKALATADRISKAKELMKSLSDDELIADYAFDAEKNVMSFTYKCGTITGQLRPAIFEDEHKQLEQNETTDTAEEISYRIVKLPDKVEYKLGESISLKGIQIEKKKGNEEPIVYTYPDVAFAYQSNIPKAPSIILHSDFRSDKAGTYKVEVVGADNVSFNVKVVDNDVTTTTATTTTVTTTTIRSTGTTPVSTDEKGRILDANGEVLIVNGTSAVITMPTTTTTTNIPDESLVFDGMKKMTLDDVWEICLRNGLELSWLDFKDFNGERLPDNNGEQQYKFIIDDTYFLLLTGNPPERPINIFLVYKDQNGVNVRVDDIVAFLLETATVKVTATVIAINENTVILKPIDGSEELKSSDRFNLPSRYLGDIKPTQGMKLEITYIGGILETDPPQFVYVHNVTVVSDVPEILKGDANCDDQVDLSDAVMIMQALANPNKYGIDGTAEHHLTEQGKLNGDMNGDGLTVGDAQAIQRKLLGLDKANSAVLFGIDKAKVTGVNVSSLPEGYDYTFTDKNAQAIVDYLSNISLSTNLSVEDPGQLNGMTWVIRLVYENGDTVTLYDLGKFIHGEDHKWYEMTYEESQEFSNLIWKLGQTDNDKSIDNSAIAGKIFAYEKEGAGGYCTLSFNENGRFLYSPGKLSSYMGGGDWKIDGDIVSLIGMVDKTIYLKITDDTLVYIAESSDEFPYMDIKDGEKFAIYRPEISSDKFQLNSRYSEYGLGNPKVELNLIASELPEFCYVENVRLYDEDDNFIGTMSPAMDADIWSYLVDCNVTEECSKTFYTLTKIRCGQKTYLDDVRSEINVNFKVTPAP